MWRPLSRPPGEVTASGLGASPGIAPGLASQKATARSPGRQPFWPTQSHLLHPMALQWPERAERALSHVKPKKEPAPASLCPDSRQTQSASCLVHRTRASLLVLMQVEMDSGVLCTRILWSSASVWYLNNSSASSHPSAARTAADRLNFFLPDTTRAAKL